MKIEFDTNSISDLDRAVLSILIGGELPTPAAEQPTPASAPATATAPVKAAPAKRAAKPAPAPEPEVPTSEEAGTTGEDLLAPADSASPEPAALTMQDVVAAATPLISGGKQDQVKAILNDFGVGRVSALTEDQFDAFVTALKAL